MTHPLHADCLERVTAEINRCCTESRYLIRLGDVEISINPYRWGSFWCISIVSPRNVVVDIAKSSNKVDFLYNPQKPNEEMSRFLNLNIKENQHPDFLLQSLESKGEIINTFGKDIGDIISSYCLPLCTMVVEMQPF